jgi:hypothetical protein
MTEGAVITADIVNSTLLPKAEAKKLSKQLTLLLEPHKHEFYRGDSFQVYIKSPEEALRLVLQLRTAAMKLPLEASMPRTDIRSSIGIGPVKLPVRELKTATEEAFVLSGRAFDKLEKDQRLVISCPEQYKTANIGFRVIADFVDFLFQRLTTKQAAVVSELLTNRNQTETAKRLKKSQATVHKHTQSAGWPQMEKLITEYRLLLGSIDI